jgi:hypothetical protein
MELPALRPSRPVAIPLAADATPRAQQRILRKQKRVNLERELLHEMSQKKIQAEDHAAEVHASPMQRGRAESLTRVVDEDPLLAQETVKVGSARASRAHACCAHTCCAHVCCARAC